MEKDNNSVDVINDTPIDLEKELGIKTEDLQDLKQSLENKKDDQGRDIRSMRDIRSLALHLLYAADRFDYSVPLDHIVESFKVGFDLNISDDSYAIKIVEGVIQDKEELDKEVAPFLKNWKLERLGCCTLLILRFALWELNQEGAIPSIVINEAVELAKSFAEKDAYKFINGILDEICKKKGLVLNSEEKKDGDEPEGEKQS